MEESEVDEYNLNSDQRQQYLRICLINNEYISLILTNKETQEKFISKIYLSQAKSLSKAFNLCQSIKEAIDLIKNQIESGKLILIEDPKEKTIEMKFNISLASGDYPPFSLYLLLENNDKEEIKSGEDLEELSPSFDYQGNKEVEQRYENTDNNTNDYSKQNLKPNVKSPNKGLQYIDPIFQVNNQNKISTSKLIQSGLQSYDDQSQNITEEQFQSIIKEFSPINDITNYNRSNSVSRATTSIYSTQTMPNSNNNIIMRANPFSNLAHPATEYQPNLKIYNSNNNNFNNYSNLNSNFNKTISNYNTISHKPFNVGNINNYESNLYLQNN